jgi:hypothetical protein
MKLLALLALMAGAANPQQPVDPFALPNAMAAAYSEWGALYARRWSTVGPHAISAQEMRAFDRYLDSVNALKKFVKPQYQ